MKTRHLCGIFALGFAPCAMAVSITQTHLFNLNNGGSSTGSIGDVTPLLFQFGPALTSVNFVADIAVIVDVLNGNVFQSSSGPVPFQAVAFMQTTFRLGDKVLPQLEEHVIGPTSILALNQFAPVFNAPFNLHYTATLTSPSDLAAFNGSITGAHSLQYHTLYSGGNVETGIVGTISMSVTYNYDAPGVPGVPDAGTTAALLAFACLGIFLAHRR